MTWSWNRRNDFPRTRINLLNRLVRNLEKIAPIEGRTRMSWNLNGLRQLSAFRIERLEFVAGGKPDIVSVVGHTMHVGRTWKWTVLALNLGSLHRSILIRGEWPWE